MKPKPHFHFDIKWVVILSIIAFLLVFQVLPVLNMVNRGVFPEGTFSLETVSRLFTYSLNREALKTTGRALPVF